MTHLDLNKIPEIEWNPSLLLFNPFDEFPSLSTLGDISERIYGCRKFLKADSDDKFPLHSESATLRAFLNEFSSLSEILRSDPHPKLNSICIDRTDYPLFHFLKLLRNVNFHVKSVIGETTSFKAVIMNKNNNETVGQEFLFKQFIISDCNIDLLASSRDIRHNDSNQIEEIVQWVNETQLNFGISDIIEATLKQYCELISVTIST